MSTRTNAMQWWNTLSSAGRTRQCDIHSDILVGAVRRWETLTGSEIEQLYIAEHTDILSSPKELLTNK